MADIAYINKNGIPVFSRTSTRETAVKIRHSKWYKSFCKSILNERGKCEKCGNTKNLTVHHVEKLSDIVMRNRIFTARSAGKCFSILNENNIQILCVKCHRNEHQESIAGQTIDRQEKTV